MDKIFAEDGQIDEAKIALDDHTPIPLVSYEENEEWVDQYREEFGMDLSFFRERIPDNNYVKESYKRAIPNI